VQPFVLRARFTYSPSMPCVRQTIEFDASASKTPHPPITRYRFTSVLTPDTNPDDLLFGIPRPWWGSTPLPFGDGPSPEATTAFDYTVDVNKVFGFRPPDVFIADPRDVTLTVTDAAGDTASYTHTVDLRQTTADPQCRLLARQFAHLRLSLVRVGWNITMNIGRLSARLPCISVVDCPGSLTLTTARRNILAAGAARRARAKAIVLGRQRFYISAHHTGTVAIALTTTGRRLLARRKRVRAVLRLTTGIAGRTVTHSVAVTLPTRR
jgi:hypothetical protein